MASRSLTTPLRKSQYICDSCLKCAPSFRNPRAPTSRAFSHASSQNRETTARRPRSFERQHRLKAIQSGSGTFNRINASSRSYSTEASTPQAVLSGIAPLPHRRLISLSGPDTTKFLQGLITNNVDSTRLSPFYSAFLDARGRVLWDVFVWVWPELVAEQGHWGCYIEVDATEVESLKKHLKKHKLRSKIVIKDVPTEGADGIRVWAAWGGAHEHVKQWSEIAGFEDPRAPGFFRYIANAERNSIAESLQPVDTQCYHVQRYLHGVPEGPSEIARETALPMESNIDLNGGIDFKKGCYVGQELTIRTKHTGVVRKRVLPVRFHAADSAVATSSPGHDSDVTSTHFNPSFSPLPQHGTDIKALDDTGAIKKGRAAGKIVAAIGNVGLASCRLENMTSMRVSAEGGTYKPGMQFGVETGGGVVRVEPVLYEWFVGRKKALWDREERRKGAVVRELDEGGVE